VFDCSSLRTFAAHTQKLIEVVSLDEERLDSMTEEEAEQLLSELNGIRLKSGSVKVELVMRRTG